MTRLPLTIPFLLTSGGDMTSVATVELLDGLGAYLASVGLAQWSEVADYRNTPGTPAVLLASSDVPDDCVVLSAARIGAVSLGEWEVTCSFRATGVGPANVLAMADAVSTHLISAFDFVGQGVWHGGTIVSLPKVTLAGGLTVVGLAQVEWGTAELTSSAAHKGARWVRTDKYRMVVRST